MKKALIVVSVVVTFIIVFCYVDGGLAEKSEYGVSGVTAKIAASGIADTGWITIAPGTQRVVNHNLGGDSGTYAVDLWYKDTDGQVYGINNRSFGGRNAAGVDTGVYWSNLTTTSVTVYRLPDDIYADQVRIRVWQSDPPAYDSGWQDILAGDSNVLTLNYNLVGSVDDYIVGIKFQDTSPNGKGVHLISLGGREVGGNFYGAIWRNFGTTSIQVLRFGSDTLVDQVRVFITIPDPPIYDSGWVDISRDTTEVLNHKVGGVADSYVVRFSQKGIQGINVYAFGGLEAAAKYFGANLENLTAGNISVYRYSDDNYAQEVRVRIWAPRMVLLPMILNDVTP